jgi:hypothetical protein
MSLASLLALSLLLAPGTPADPDAQVFWKPDPAAGRLEMDGILGGWFLDPPVPAIRFRVEGDPRPARSPEEDYWDYWERMREVRRAAILARVKARLPGEDPGNWDLIRLLDWPEKELDPENLPLAMPREVAFLARYARARAEVVAELDAAEAARRHPVRLWFNGRIGKDDLEANRTWRPDLEGQAGENRLEVRDEATGQTLVRSWWQEGRLGPRLQVRARGDWVSLKVLEPGGKVEDTTRYHRANPGPGTYTVSWGDYVATHHAWWGEDGAAPREVVVDVLLDAGTDRERHLVFRRLCMPGEGEAVLGTFDVED